MYAIIETGGKQYRVEPQNVLDVEDLKQEVGEEVVIDHVLLVSNDGQVMTGKPYVAGAKVVCRLMAHTKGDKVDIFDYKAKDNVRRKKGHRQLLSRLKVESIVTGA